MDFKSLFLLFLITKLNMCRAIEVTEFAQKLIRAEIHNRDWKAIHDQRENHGMDLFFSRRIKNDSWELTFTAWPDTIEMLNKSNITWEVMSKDIKTTLGKNYEWKKSNNTRRTESLITFTKFLNLQELYDYVKTLPKHSTTNKNIFIESIGKSIQNRDIWMVKIEPVGATQIMFFDAGIHAREWLSVMTAVYMLSELVKPNTESPVNQMKWYIVPCLNPDGYEATFNSQKTRLQRKNMHTENCPKSCGNCGVDLNRNFGYKFGGLGTSGNPCSEIYRGPRAFSEPESCALRDVLEKHVKNITLYLSLHSYGSLLMYPWGYDRKPCDDWRELKEAALYATAAMRKYSSAADYTVESSGADFYPAAGGSDDYAKHLGIKYSYTMEVQGGGDTGFDPPASIIKASVKANYVGVTKLAEFIHNNHSIAKLYTDRSIASFVVCPKPLITSILLWCINFK